MDNSTAPPDHYVTTTDQDHGAFLWITSVNCLAYSLFALMGRFYVKWHKLGSDDAFISVSQGVAVAQYIAFFYAIVNGLGKSSEITTLRQERRWSKGLLASQILLLGSHALAKCSTILLVRRLFTRDFKICWIVSNIALGIYVAWGLASIIAVSAGCSPSHVLADVPSTICPNDVLRWKGVTATDVITEASIILLPTVYVSFIRFSIRKKFLVIIAFSFRIPCIAFSVLFYRTYARFIGVDHGEGVLIVLPLIFQQLLLLASLLGATVPCLKAYFVSSEAQSVLPRSQPPAEFLEDRRKGSREEPAKSISYRMAAIKNDLILSSLSSLMSRDVSRQNSIVHESGKNSANESRAGSRNECEKSKRGNGIRTSEEFDRMKMRPEPVQNTTTVYAEERRSRDEKYGDGFPEMIIRRDMEWDVKSEEIGHVT